MPFEEPVPADRIEGGQHVGPCRATGAPQQGGEVTQRVMVVGSEHVPPPGHGFGHAVKGFELDIEIADVTEGRRHPPELGPKDPGPHRQDLDEEIERGPETPRGDAHVVQLLGVLAQPRPGLLGPQNG